MDIEEIAEKIAEREQEEKQEDQLHNRVAIYIGIVAILLAITGLGGNNATKDYMGANISAADVYAHYQAKSIRETVYALTAEELSALLASRPDLPEQSRADLAARIERLKAATAHYESDPEHGDGKKELLAKAQAFEKRRDIAQERDPYFDYAEALLQISILLASVSLVAKARVVLWASFVLAALGTLLMINAFTLLVNIPFL